MKILIIDDNDVVRNVLRETLIAEGYEVLLARDGSEGLALARDGRPDLVVTDVLMPHMDGFQFLRAVRQDDDLRTLPVVFLTANYLDAEDRDLAVALGVSRFLIKPCRPSDIVATVREALESGRDRQSAQPVRPPLEEPVFLKKYNEQLVKKLKDKVVELEAARNNVESIMESMTDGVVVIDRDYRIIRANAAAAASLGTDIADLIGRKCYSVTHKRDTPCEGPHIICPLPRIFERGENTVKVLHTHFDRQGGERHFEISASAVRDSEGRIFAMVETFRNILDKYSDDELLKLVKRLNEAQSHLKLMAITDDLTGLRNRRYIVERLEEEFQRSKRTGGALSLIMLDIDHFKQINDAHGHLFGDVVLRVVAARIKAGLRKHDIVGRVGGEEFLVICPASTREETVIVAERIRKLISDEKIGDGIREVDVALSAGVTALDENDSGSERVFSRADTALYKAKEEGRNRVVTL